MFFFAPGGLAAGGWVEVAAAGMAAGPGRVGRGDCVAVVMQAYEEPTS